MQNNFEIITLNKKEITDFADERNKLLHNANSDWVLFLDSDEKISNLHRIAGYLFPISNEFTCYQFTRKNYFLGQFVGKDKIIRLVKKETGRWVRQVHEVWVPDDEKVGVINTPIIHNTADNLHDYISKINFYSDLHAKANMEEGKTSTLFKIIFYPPLKFIVSIIKSRNMIFSIIQSLHSFLSWSKQWILQNA